MAVTRAYRFSHWSIALLSLLAVPLLAGVHSAQQAGLVGIIGRWVPVNDQGPALKADGAAWNGETSAADLEAAGRSLFLHIERSFVTHGVAPGAFPLAVYRAVRDFTNGAIRVQFKIVGGASDQNAGIVFGLQPTGEYLFARYNTKDGNVAIWEYRGGERRVIVHGEAHKQLPMNAWHELVVTVAGNRVSASVTGQSLTVQHVLDRPLTGRVGVWVKRDAVTVFRDFRVTQ
jgi:hypothetical protein